MGYDRFTGKVASVKMLASSDPEWRRERARKAVAARWSKARERSAEEEESDPVAGLGLAERAIREGGRMTTFVERNLAGIRVVLREMGYEC